MSPIVEKLTQLLARLQGKIPEQRVGLVPADAFFTRKVDLPAGLGEAERVAFVQLHLEGNSPFPMEQLAWGYLAAPEAPHAFVYATPKSRLKRLEFTHPESYFHLFPGFITLFGEVQQRPVIRFISQNGVIAAVHLPAGQAVPEKVATRRIGAELLTDDVQLETRDQLLASLDTRTFAAEDGLWLGEGCRIDPDGGLVFQHRHLSRTSPSGVRRHRLPLADTPLWAADLRDDAYAARERAVRQKSVLIWRGLHLAIGTAVVLLALQLLVFGLMGYNALQQRRVGILEPQAVRVENKLTLAGRLTQSTEEDLRPFLLMEAINPARPDSIFYDKVRSKAFNEIEIEGQSTEGVTPVNAFADSISQMEFVESVENNSQTRNNQTSFELLIRFSAMPPAPEGGFVIPDEEEVAEAADSNG